MAEDKTFGNRGDADGGVAGLDDENNVRRRVEVGLVLVEESVPLRRERVTGHQPVTQHSAL